MGNQNQAKQICSSRINLITNDTILVPNISPDIKIINGQFNNKSLEQINRIEIFIYNKSKIHDWQVEKRHFFPTLT